jgi:hypothetical protein
MRGDALILSAIALSGAYFVNAWWPSQPYATGYRAGLVVLYAAFLALTCFIIAITQRRDTKLRFAVGILSIVFIVVGADLARIADHDSWWPTSFATELLERLITICAAFLAFAWLTAMVAGTNQQRGRIVLYALFLVLFVGYASFIRDFGNLVELLAHCSRAIMAYCK